MKTVQAPVFKGIIWILVSHLYLWINITVLLSWEHFGKDVVVDAHWKERRYYQIMKGICSALCLPLNLFLGVLLLKCHKRIQFSQLFSLFAVHFQPWGNDIHLLIAGQFRSVCDASQSVDETLISNILQQISGGLQTWGISNMQHIGTNHLQVETWYGPLPLLYPAQ